MSKCVRCGAREQDGAVTGKCLPCEFYEFYEDADIDGLTDFVLARLAAAERELADAVAKRDIALAAEAVAERERDEALAALKAESDSGWAVRDQWVYACKERDEALREVDGLCVAVADRETLCAKLREALDKCADRTREDSQDMPGLRAQNEFVYRTASAALALTPADAAERVRAEAIEWCAVQMDNQAFACACADDTMQGVRDGEPWRKAAAAIRALAPAAAGKDDAEVRP